MCLTCIADLTAENARLRADVERLTRERSQWAEIAETAQVEREEQRQRAERAEAALTTAREALEPLIGVAANSRIQDQFVYDRRGCCIGTVFELRPRWVAALAKAREIISDAVRKGKSE